MREFLFQWVDLAYKAKGEKLRETRALGPINFYCNDVDIPQKCSRLCHVNDPLFSVAIDCEMAPEIDPFGSVFASEISRRVWQLGIVIATDAPVEALQRSADGFSRVISSHPAQVVQFSGSVNWREPMELLINRARRLGLKKDAHVLLAAFRKGIASLPIPIKAKSGNCVMDGVLVMSDSPDQYGIVSIVAPIEHVVVEMTKYELWYPDEFRSFEYAHIADFYCSGHRQV